MKLKSLQIRELYGYINKDIVFNDDITLLVGINGSGKTSILNVINWIVSPSIADLCITQFKFVKLNFEFKDTEYEILCKHNTKTFKYEMKSSNEKFNPLIIKIRVPPSQIARSEELRNNLLSHYSSLTPDPKEEKIWAILREIPSPTVIGLDRNMYTEESGFLYTEEINRNRIIKQRKITISPVERVKQIVNTEYTKRKNTILNLTSRLKNQLMLSAFEGSISLDSFKTGIQHKLTLNQIETVETSIKNYIYRYEQNTFNENDLTIITAYFAQLKDIVKQYQNNKSDETAKLLFGLNANQFLKTTKLLREFERFEKDSDKTLELINTYLDTLNFFFKDSSKKLVFNDETSELSYNILDKDGNTLSKYKDIRLLSSGEQQILILFSYLAFNNKNGRIFIIDEPEISLHIKWQEDFLEYLEKIMPKTTQVLLATHSPVIVAKRKEKAVLLLSYNN